MDALKFINLEAKIQKIVWFLRFRERFSLMVCQGFAEPDTIFHEEERHTPKVKVMSGYVPESYSKGNEGRKSDYSIEGMRIQTNKMVQSVYDCGLRYGFNKWHKDIYKKARKIVIPNHIKIQPIEESAEKMMRTR